MRQADQSPFATNLSQTAQQEPPKAPSLLDLAKHRLGDRLSPRVDRPTRGRLQLRLHLLFGCPGFGSRLRLRLGRAGRGVVPLTLGRDVRIESLTLQRRHGLRTEVTCVQG